jgi:hypothetical protein
MRDQIDKSRDWVLFVALFLGLYSFLDVGTGLYIAFRDVQRWIHSLAKCLSLEVTPFAVEGVRWLVWPLLILGGLTLSMSYHLIRFADGCHRFIKTRSYSPLVQGLNHQRRFWRLCFLTLVAVVALAGWRICFPSV